MTVETTLLAVEGEDTEGGEVLIADGEVVVVFLAPIALAKLNSISVYHRNL